MTDDEARETLAQNVPRETMARIEHYVALLRVAARSQNLISASTLASVWSRHILDSAQLVPLVPSSGTWMDIGSGAGLPGVVTALMTGCPTILIEPRTKRCDFLRSVVELLPARNLSVVQSRAEAFGGGPAGVISARAVAPLAHLFESGAHLADRQTVWLLPKGRSAHAEVTAAAKLWHVDVTMVRSVTDCDSSIVVARDVRRRARP